MRFTCSRNFGIFSNLRFSYIRFPATLTTRSYEVISIIRTSCLFINSVNILLRYYSIIINYTCRFRSSSRFVRSIPYI
nr:MAG TPA: hypothetical protein [Bacteriophage sp.]